MHSISSENPDNGVSNFFLLRKECVHKALIPSVPCQSHNTIFVKIEAD